jgi:uncharacterized protein YcgI (DUF1989 family)
VVPIEEDATVTVTQRIELPPNSGASVEVEAGQLLHVRGRTIVDLVAFDRHDLTHRFDQARTKANQGKIFVSVGDVLVSKNNVDMMRIEVDTFEGHHDLQYGTCSRSRWEWALREGIAARTYLRDGQMGPEDFPDHGCLENILSGLERYDVPEVDVPSPLNLFQHMEIDGRTGAMRHTTVRPASEGHVAFRVLIDLIVAVSACPDLLVGGSGVVLEIEDVR